MDWPTRAKLALALAAAIFLAGSIWLERDWPRYVAMGLLAVAVLLRFVYPGRRREDDRPRS